jgi:hypothetical protein
MSNGNILIAVIDDDDAYASAMRKYIETRLCEANAPELSSYAPVVKCYCFVGPDSESNSKLGIEYLITRLTAYGSQLRSGQSDAEGALHIPSDLPQFYFCDVFMATSEEAGPPTMSLAFRIKNAINAIHVHWSTLSNHTSEKCPFRIHFWSAEWPRLPRGDSTHLVLNSVRQEPEAWAAYSVKPSMPSAAHKESQIPDDLKIVTKQLAKFSAERESNPLWIFAGSNGATLKTNLQSLVNSQKVVIVTSRSATAQRLVLDQVQYWDRRGTSRPRSPGLTSHLLNLMVDFLRTDPTQRRLAVELPMIESDGTDGDGPLIEILLLLNAWSDPDKSVVLSTDENSVWHDKLRVNQNIAIFQFPSPKDRPEDVPAMVRAATYCDIAPNIEAAMKAYAHCFDYHLIAQLPRNEYTIREFDRQDCIRLRFDPNGIRLSVNIDRYGGITVSSQPPPWAATTNGFEKPSCSSQETKSHVIQRATDVSKVLAILILLRLTAHEDAYQAKSALTIRQEEFANCAAELRKHVPNLWSTSELSKRQLFSSSGHFVVKIDKYNRKSTAHALGELLGMLGIKTGATIKLSGDTFIVELGQSFAVCAWLGSDQFQWKCSTG